MVIVSKPRIAEVEKTQPPEKLITAKQVCYWYEEKGELEGSQGSKAKKFVENNAIKRIDNDNYECYLPGYNKSKKPHRMNFNGQWTCTCQHFKKYGTWCSHIIGARLLNFKEKWNDRNN